MIASFINSFHRLINCDFRPLMLNVAHSEMALVPFGDIVEDPLMSEKNGRPARTTTMAGRTGEYVVLRADDLLKLLEDGVIPVGDGKLPIQDPTVILLEDRGGNHSIENALSVETHIPWCTEVVDSYPIVTLPSYRTR